MGSSGRSAGCEIRGPSSAQLGTRHDAPCIERLPRHARPSLPVSSAATAGCRHGGRESVRCILGKDDPLRTHHDSGMCLPVPIPHAFPAAADHPPLPAVPLYEPWHGLASAAAPQSACPRPPPRLCLRGQCGRYAGQASLKAGIVSPHGEKLTDSDQALHGTARIDQGACLISQADFGFSDWLDHR